MNSNLQGYSKLKLHHIISWSLVSIIYNMMMIPMNAIIPAYYAKYTQTTLSEIGLVLLIARFYDAAADPVVGYLSDRTVSPLGRRKPWILAGAILASAAVFLMFNPAASATGAYFLPVILMFYTAYSMLSVPHSAWGSELSRVDHERSRISGLMTFAGVFGLLLFMGLPLLLSSPILPLFPTAEVTPGMLKLLGWLIVILAPICILAAVVMTPRGAGVTETPVTLKGMAAALAGNRPFWVFSVAYAFTGLGYGVYYATTYLFIDGYLGLGERFTLIYALAALSQIVSIPIWMVVIKHVERHRMWAVGIAVFGLLLVMRYFIPRGEAGFPLIIALVIISGFANAASQVPQMAVLADCIDYDTLKTGRNRAASYYAVQSFILKAMLAIGGGAAFLILGALHYDAKATVHTESSLSALADVNSLGPLFLFLVAGVLLWLFPLNRRRQDVIRRRLDNRACATLGKQ